MNLVIEVLPQTRIQLLQNKLKLQWMICYVEDNVSVNRCFKCSGYNQTQNARAKRPAHYAQGNTNWKNVQHQGQNTNASTAWNTTYTTRTGKLRKTTHHLTGAVLVCRQRLINTDRTQITKMAQTDHSKKRTIQEHKNTKPQTLIRCMQINLQHSRIATDNLMKLTEQEKSDIICIQETYLYKHRMTGISNSYRSYTSLEDNNQATIVITNQLIDAVLITQLSDTDTVLLELDYNNTRFFTASIYFDITTEIEKELVKIDHIVEFTKGNGLIMR